MSSPGDRSTPSSPGAPRLRALLPVLLSAALTGCGSTPDGPGGRSDAGDSDRITVQIKEPPNQTLALEPFKIDWSDIEIDDKGERDSYEVARWATERHNAVMRCLNLQPPARVQALQILEDLLSKVPNSSRDRFLLGRTRFTEAAYWFQAADAVAYNTSWVQNMKQTPPSAGSRSLTDEEVEELVAGYKPWLEYANRRLRETSGEAIKHFTLYRELRPDDKSILEFVWRLFFYQQQYDNALKWLEYLLGEMDAAEVPAEEPRRREYALIRERLRDYLVNLTLDEVDRPKDPARSLLPWDDADARAAGRSLYGVDRR